MSSIESILFLAVFKIRCSLGILLTVEIEKRYVVDLKLTGSSSYLATESRASVSPFVKKVRASELDGF